MEAAERARQILAKHRNFQSSNPQQQQMLDECFVFAFVKGANWKEATTDEEILEEIVKGNNWYNTNEPFQIEVEIVDDSKRAEIEDTILRLLFKKGELIPGLRINKSYKQSLDKQDVLSAKMEEDFAILMNNTSEAFAKFFKKWDKDAFPELRCVVRKE